METQKLEKAAEARHPAWWMPLIPMLTALGIVCAPLSLLLGYQLYQLDRTSPPRYEIVIRTDNDLVWKLGLENDALERRLDEALGLAGTWRMIAEYHKCVDGIHRFPTDRSDRFWIDFDRRLRERCATAARWYETHPFDSESVFLRLDFDR